MIMSNDLLNQMEQLIERATIATHLGRLDVARECLKQAREIAIVLESYKPEIGR